MLAGGTLNECTDGLSEACSSLERPNLSHHGVNNTTSHSAPSSLPIRGAPTHDAPEQFKSTRGGNSTAMLNNYPQTTDYRRNVLINPADYQCNRESAVGEGWKSLADQVSSGSYNLSPPGTDGSAGRNAGKTSTSGVLPMSNDYRSPDQCIR